MTYSSHTPVTLSVSSPNCALNLVRISAGFTFSVGRHLTTMCRATTEGTTCSLIVITADRRQIDKQRYVITVIRIPSITISNVILFYAGIPALEKEGPDFLIHK
jgi:hypothetical protein